MRCTCALAVPVAPHTSTYTATTPEHFITTNGVCLMAGWPAQASPGQPGRRAAASHTPTLWVSLSCPLLGPTPTLPDLWSCRARDQQEGPDVHICKKGVRRAGHPVVAAGNLRACLPTRPHIGWSVSASTCLSIVRLSCLIWLSSRPEQIKTSGTPSHSSGEKAAPDAASS